MNNEHPTIENAPGHAWKKRVRGWEIRWQARTDLVRRGFLPKSQKLWTGAVVDLTEAIVQDIQQRCNELQDEMLVWGRGGIPLVGTFDGSLRSLIYAYQTDADSGYRKLRFTTRTHYDNMCKRLDQMHGSELIEDIKARSLLRWHEGWLKPINPEDPPKVATAHSLIGMLRTLVNFGATFLESDPCIKLSGILSNMRFEMGKPRSERLTASQATAIRAKAHELGLHSLALAQAFQFDLMLRQKDVIGEWVPMSEKGSSEITDGNEKWLRGLRGSEIDGNLILRHVTSKRQKEIEVDLRLAPMVMEELSLIPNRFGPGPIIICEKTDLPYTAVNFRRHWRAIATLCGIPKSVKNMDSRAGAISEATDAGAELEHVRHAATHSDVAMTQRYSRGSTDKTANVMRLRAAHRNKTGS